MTIQCTICMSHMSVNEAANAATCGHVFHEPCLVQWFVRSKTCPQCRARCDERQVRRLYFSAALNNSTVDVDTLQVELDDMKLELRNLKTDLESKKREIQRLRGQHEMDRESLLGMQAKEKLAKVEIQNANAEIVRLKSDLARLRAAEKALQEKMEQLNTIEYIKSVLESDSVVSEIELLKSQLDVKALAAMVSASNHELRKVTRSRDEVKNHRRVCLDENTKLKRQIKELGEKINTLESDNYKLKDDLSQLQMNNEAKSTENKDAAPSSTSIQPKHVALPADNNSSASPRTDSPYLNIRQSNVGLTPLLNRKRKPEAETNIDQFKNLSIFNSRQKMSKTSRVQSSSLIYNGFGGSERKENFIGFPRSQTKTNPAGRGLSNSFGTSKPGQSQK